MQQSLHTNSPILERLAYFMLVSGAFFVVFLALAYSSVDSIANIATLRDYALSALPWFIAAIFLSGLVYTLTDESFILPFLGANMFSVWCLSNMLLPLFYAVVINDMYVSASELDLYSDYKLTAFVTFLFYLGFKYDLFDASAPVYEIKK